ncbi:hypothetical protein COLO4_17642 [Corchorus olitorius]|uniref:Uncharacterized protein n=1 Tax=Corchorus olitorius TaxID=93759 RepID=A0A1R3JC20_9ROSI|nr:hypothetical protein COLO4_17642 [Corchorus olitorius]
MEESPLKLSPIYRSKSTCHRTCLPFRFRCQKSKVHPHSRTNDQSESPPTHRRPLKSGTYYAWENTHNDCSVILTRSHPASGRSNPSNKIPKMPTLLIS